MKTWMIIAAVAALAPMTASAQWAAGSPLIPANESVRAELIKEIEANREVLLPQTAPLPQVTVRFQPRLNHIKDAVGASRTEADLFKAKKDFADWKAVVLRDLFNQDRVLIPGAETFTAFSARRSSEANVVLALRQQMANQRVAAETSPILEVSRNPSTTSASWSNIFDNNRQFAAGPTAPTSFGAIAGTGRFSDFADVPAGAARYEKIRKLLLAKGVSKQIIDTAIAEGIRYKVDPMIVFSVINQESNFKKNARNSGSGATGLMQLMPDTAADMGVRGNLYDVGANIRAGVKYLDWIANKFFKMNLDMSDISRVPAEKLKIILASYNWGIGNVQKMVRRHGTSALDRIAPKETRNYISEIPSRIASWFASF